MKKSLCALLSFLSVGIGAYATPLFPHFVDVAGDYNDNVCPDFEEIGIQTLYWKYPSFYSTVKEADMFLNDVMPYSTEEISRREIDVKNSKVITYSSPMSDGKISIIYLYETPDKKFAIGYIEKTEK